MEIVKTKFKYKCPKHPNFKVEFLQIDNVDTNFKDNSLFYCSACIEYDSRFNKSNYQLIQNIITTGEDQILPKWPPVLDNQLLNKLIQTSIGKGELESIEAQIETYFTDLKNEMFQQIDICKKQMIKCAQELLMNKTQIIKEYQDISKINELRSLLVDNRIDFHEKERQCRGLIEKILSEKKTITEQLTSLLNQNQKQAIFSLETAHKLKQQIVQSIREINFYEYPDNYKENNGNNQRQLDVKLLKTNYGTDQIYLEIRENEANQQQVTLNKSSMHWLNVVSSIILEREKKYIFRIQIQITQDNNKCFVGLMQDENIHKQTGFQDSMGCLFESKNQQILKYSKQLYGIDKQIKGETFVLSQESEIEIRISIEDSILELLDYPHHHYKIGLNGQSTNLLKRNNLRLFFGMSYIGNKIILKEALSVQKFE